MTALLLTAALAAQQSAFAAEGRFGVTPPQLAHQQGSVGGAVQTPTTIPEMWTAWCARCHADDGSGKVNEPTVTVVPMDFTDCKVTTPEPDADWERAIAKGGPGVGLSPQMPAFEDSLTPQQVRGFVSHMRTMCKETGWPGGNANFPRPILTEKAFPENEFVILPAVAHYSEELAPSITETEFVAVYERRVGKRSMLEIELPIVGTNSLGQWSNGLGDITVAVKHALLFPDASTAAPPRILSAGLEVVLPTGDRFEDHGHGTQIYEPFISAGAMFGNWYLQSELKVELPADITKADRTVVYNTYVGRDTSAAPNTWTLGLELNYEGELPTTSSANHAFALTPQVRKGLTGTGALAAALGVTLPLNKREQQGIKWVGYLLWEYLEPWRARR